jgi:hypothetical protein
MNGKKLEETTEKNQNTQTKPENSNGEIIKKKLTIKTDCDEIDSETKKKWLKELYGPCSLTWEELTCPWTNHLYERSFPERYVDKIEWENLSQNK